MPNLSPKECKVLSMLLGDREKYGLEMVRESGGEIARGTIYVTLERMTDKGYVASRLEEPRASGGPPRRLYRITGLGQRRYYAELAMHAVMARETAFA